MAALVLADHDNSAVAAATRNAITAAREMAGTVDVLVGGENCRNVAEEIARLEGVRKVVLAQAPSLAHYLPENVAPLLVLMAGEYEHIVAPATTNGKNVLPRVAALLDVAQISEISAVVSNDTFERPIYAGNAIAVVRSKDPVKVVTVRASRFAPAADVGAAASIDELEYDADAASSRFVRDNVSITERPDLATATVVVSGGRGLGSKEAFDSLAALADTMNAAVGASRAAVDAGFAPSDLQVGQTGKVVAPDLYVAIGISGAIQHLAGMKDSKTIVAINKDPDAPIFQIADVGLVGDLFAIVPQLRAALGSDAAD
ncbi:electron transfer flavoprotein subunit alpha/FixB family protein [Burkholderia sp. Bp9140]|uniref:electron transfer flavoprotein subunit alpha/FixB family protein n=1 Tax=Burkholderia sp. Bp9140 TaxID=2184572 RepID=UPI000F58B964|nr:FAD-binding protein [Burkholderia sp. Bp9140]RQR51596.1 electron transfer flavoprotein subunit alpha/FixB family protein [Burkholderia sp. Bp9140]